MSIRKPVSPPMQAKVRGSYQCYIDWENKLWLGEWKGSMAYPDFSSIPLKAVDLSKAASTTWSLTTLLNFGSGAVIRLSNEPAFPVVKIAHPDAKTRRQLQHEFEFMRGVVGFTGIAKVDPDPLIDEEGIYGFRQEYLYKVELEARGDEVRAVVVALHEAGYCHGDLSPSNVMINRVGDVVLIDFALSGRIGQIVPQYIADSVYEGGVFNTAADVNRLKMFLK